MEVKLPENWKEVVAYAQAIDKLKDPSFYKKWNDKADTHGIPSDKYVQEHSVDLEDFGIKKGRDGMILGTALEFLWYRNPLVAIKGLPRYLHEKSKFVSEETGQITPLGGIDSSKITGGIVGVKDWLNGKLKRKKQLFDEELSYSFAGRYVNLLDEENRESGKIKSYITDTDYKLKKTYDEIKKNVDEGILYDDSINKKTKVMEGKFNTKNTESLKPFKNKVEIDLPRYDNKLKKIIEVIKKELKYEKKIKRELTSEFNIFNEIYKNIFEKIEELDEDVKERIGATEPIFDSENAQGKVKRYINKKLNIDWGSIDENKIKSLKNEYEELGKLEIKIEDKLNEMENAKKEIELRYKETYSQEIENDMKKLINGKQK